MLETVLTGLWLNSSLLSLAIWEDDSGYLPVPDLLLAPGYPQAAPSYQDTDCPLWCTAISFVEELRWHQWLQPRHEWKATWDDGEDGVTEPPGEGSGCEVGYPGRPQDNAFGRGAGHAATSCWQQHRHGELTLTCCGAEKKTAANIRNPCCDTLAPEASSSNLAFECLLWHSSLWGFFRQLSLWRFIHWPVHVSKKTLAWEACSLCLWNH